MPVSLINSVSILLVNFRFPPAPTTTIGLFAVAILSTAAFIDLFSAIARLTDDAGIGISSECSSAISSGSSKCTAPGFSCSAIRSASLTRLGILSAATNCSAYFVIGFIISTTSSI